MAALRDFVWVGGGRLATAVLTLVAIRCATQALGPAQYGELALLVSVQVFCGLFLVNPVGQYINRHTHEWWDDGTLLARLSAYRRYVLLVAATGAALVLLSGLCGLWTATLLSAVALAVMVVAATWNATSIPLLNMIGRRAGAAGWGTLTVALGLVASLLLVRWLPSAVAWFAGQALGMAAGALGAGHALRRLAPASGQARGRLPLIDRATVLSYCLPLAVATGFMWLQLSGWRFAMEHFWGLAALGFAAVGLALATQLWGLVESLAMQFLSPLFFRRITRAAPEEASAAFSDLLNVQGPVYLVLAGATVAAAAPLLFVLADPRYHGAAGFLMLGALVECCRVLGNVLGNAAQVTRRTRALALPYAAGALVLSLVVLWAGLHRAPLHWVGVALGAGALAMLVTMTWSMRLQLRFALDARRWAGGLLALLALLALATQVPAPVGLAQALEWLLLVGVASAVLALPLLWNNPALQRLLAVRLTEEGRAP